MSQLRSVSPMSAVTATVSCGSDLPLVSHSSCKGNIWMQKEAVRTKRQLVMRLPKKQMEPSPLSGPGPYERDSRVQPVQSLRPY